MSSPTQRQPALFEAATPVRFARDDTGMQLTDAQPGVQHLLDVPFVATISACPDR